MPNNNNWFISLTPAPVPATLEVNAGDNITFVNTSPQGITLSNLPGILSPPPPTSQSLPVGGGTTSYNVNASSSGGSYTWTQGTTTGSGIISILSPGVTADVITIKGATATPLTTKPGNKVVWLNANAFPITITLPLCVSPSNQATITLAAGHPSATYTINAQASSNNYSWTPTTRGSILGVGQGTIDVS